MKKISAVFFGIAGLSLMAGFSTTAFSLYTGSTPTNKTLTIGLGMPEPTGFFAKVYRTVESSPVLVSSNALIVNTENDHELVVKNVSMQKGDRIKGTDETNWFGSSSSYEHNITVGCTTGSGLVSEGGDYYAVQTGTYDFYLKFNSSTYSPETYVSTYVKLHEVREVYLQDTWLENTSPQIHYWGDNVIVSNADNYVGGSKMTTQKDGYDMYKVVVPQTASSFNIYYQSKWSNNLDFSDSDNAYEVYWDDAMKIRANNWDNPL